MPRPYDTETNKDYDETISDDAICNGQVHQHLFVRIASRRAAACPLPPCRPPPFLGCGGLKTPRLLLEGLQR